jgi:sorting nexin-13
MLLLMDEVFDLKHRHQWLRRRIVDILRQIIKTTFGDRINKKIVDYVDDATSTNQIAEYVKLFRESYWPGGVLAEPAAERPYDVRRRMRVVTKARMIGSISGAISYFIV